MSDSEFLKQFEENLAVAERNKPLVEKINKALDQIRPAIQGDGGDVAISNFDAETGTLYLMLQGACSGCPSSRMTLKGGIENYLREMVPEVKRVEAVGV